MNKVRPHGECVAHTHQRNAQTTRSDQSDVLAAKYRGVAVEKAEFVVAGSEEGSLVGRLLRRVVRAACCSDWLALRSDLVRSYPYTHKQPTRGRPDERPALPLNASIVRHRSHRFHRSSSDDTSQSETVSDRSAWLLDKHQLVSLISTHSNP